MKKVYIFSLIALTLLLAACSMDVNDSTLNMTVSRVRSEKVGIEIFPISNDFYYMYGAVTQEKYNSFRNDRRFIEADFEENEKVCNVLNGLLAEYGYPQKSIEEMLFYNGSVDDVIANLEPNTDYYVYAYCLNSRNKPIHKLIKHPFTTPAKPHSDIEFTVQMEDNATVRIIPSNGDSYFWEASSKAEVFNYYQVDVADTTYDASLMLPIWFSGVIYTNYKWDFNLTSVGVEDVYLSDFTDEMRDGDVFYLACVGFTTEETTKESLYQITYHSTQPSEIEKVESWLDDDSDADESQTKALEVLRRRPNMQQWNKLLIPRRK